jgi:serine/threonine protein kinase
LKILPKGQFISTNDLKIRKKNPTNYYVKEDYIGKGYTSVVYLVTSIHNMAQKFAIKEITLEGSKKLNVINEIHLLRTSKHPNIIELYEVYKHNKQHFLVMELARMSLEDLLQRVRDLDEDVIVYILYSLAKGLEYLHARSRVHRDIKSGNVLLIGDG